MLYKVVIRISSPIPIRMTPPINSILLPIFPPTYFPENNAATDNPNVNRADDQDG